MSKKGQESVEVLHDISRDLSAMNGYQMAVDGKEVVERINYILRGDAGKEEK